MRGRYPIRALAKITGLSLDTPRAWERRYQAVVPERTGRGREYGPEQMSTSPGESHDFGILAASILASLAGLEPVCLGPGLPVADIVQAVDRTSARIVSIGITLPSPATIADLIALDAELPPDVELRAARESKASNCLKSEAA